MDDIIGKVTLDFGELSEKDIDEIMKNDKRIRLISNLADARTKEGAELLF